MTATERSAVVRSAVNEANLVLNSGDVPSKNELSSLISMINNTLWYIFSVPGDMPADTDLLKKLRNKAYSLYSKKYGRIVQKGLNIVLE